MNYTETLDWMFHQLPMYQRVGGAAYKANLDNTIALLQHLDNPHRNFKSVHIAGTNGKGSTSHLLASIFQEAGYKTGLYTSPHLRDFRERIRINGEMIPEDKVVAFIDQHKAWFEQMELSFFEMTVGMAFDYFAKEQVDIAIVEVGMGGRLDSPTSSPPNSASSPISASTMCSSWATPWRKSPARRRASSNPASPWSSARPKRKPNPCS